ncbi:MAG TPA: AbrB/MazE/SpoVT family DNA-binding domain-containing protein [Firmicutes bacterium]|nr:AbrB/MazE/SpoVT family DNA-binding domain-containing protein [Bacillota bacterium]
MKPRHKFYGAVTMGERGQIVIPQEAREEMRLSPGDKLLVFSRGAKGMGLSIMCARDVSEFVARAMEELSMFNEATCLGKDSTCNHQEETPGPDCLVEEKDSGE